MMEVVGEARLRPEYVELGRELGFLRDSFALPCSDALRDGVCTTLEAFECLDRHYDDERVAERRSAFAAEMIRFLRHAGPTALPDPVVEHLECLRRVFASHIEAVANRLTSFVETTERARTTFEITEYIAAVEAEGRLTSEMVLLLFGGDPPSSFRDFFVRLGIVGNLVDKLCDVREDFANGELAIEPSTALYLRLVGAFVAHAAVAVALFPRRAALIVWGAKYFRPLFRVPKRSLTKF